MYTEHLSPPLLSESRKQKRTKDSKAPPLLCIYTVSTTQPLQSLLLRTRVQNEIRPVAGMKLAPLVLAVLRRSSEYVRVRGSYYVVPRRGCWLLLLLRQFVFVSNK